MSQTILAIDYGTKRVGVAVAWSGLAEPLVVLVNSETLFSELTRLVEEYHPDLVLVGLSEQEMAEKTKFFVDQLKQHLLHQLGKVPDFTFADETLSSVEVQERLKQTGKHHLNSKGPIDHFAAAQFLQEYLDLHQMTENQ